MSTAAVDLPRKCWADFFHLSIQYHTALIHLLQPLLHLDGYSETDYEALRQHVLNHARSGIRFLYQYQKAYSQYFLTPLQIFCMVHICEALTRYGRDDSQSPTISEAVDFCLSALEQTRISYPLAGPLQQMFRTSLKEQGRPIPKEVERRIEAPNRHTPDELLDACIRPTYRLPVSQILSNMEPNLGQSFMDTWNELTKDTNGGTQGGKNKAGRQMNIQDMLNN